MQQGHGRIRVNRFHMVMNLLDQDTAGRIFQKAGFDILDVFYYTAPGGRKIPAGEVGPGIGIVLQKGTIADTDFEASFLLNECDTLPSCDYCKTTDCTLKICGGCKKASYCSASCQKKDWGRHKRSCKKSR